jgi:hypothetical protein
MCGIVGVINWKNDHKFGMERVMRELLWAGTLRGSDATGVYCIQKDGNTDWAKAVIDGWTFIDKNERGKHILFHAETHQFILGHNRSATQGSASEVKYAHPIVIDKKIALVHNGTLNHWPGKSIKNSTVHDSTAITKMFANGTDIEDFVNTCHGAYSLVWHDIEKDTLNFLRNADRPMAMVYTADRIFFGSELGMLLWILQRHDMVPLRQFYTEPMTHYSFKIGESVPQETKITKSYSSSGGRRFPGEEVFDPYDDGYGGYRDGFDYQRGFGGHPYGRQPGFTRTTPPYTSSGRHASNDGVGEAARNAGSGASGRIGQSSSQNAHQETSKGKETSKTTQEGGTTSGKTDNVIDIKRAGNTKKAAGKLVENYKSFFKGTRIIFSIDDWSDVKATEDGKQRYNIYATPKTPDDFPEVQVRGTVSVTALDPEILKTTDRYLSGKVANVLLSTDSGNVVVWVKDVEITGIVDPGWSTKKAIEGQTVTAGPNPGVLLNVKDKEKPEEKELCQHCNDLFPKSKLRFVQESFRESDRLVHYMLRFCDPCLLKYATDRKPMVSPATRNQEPVETLIRKVH